MQTLYELDFNNPLSLGRSSDEMRSLARALVVNNLKEFAQGSEDQEFSFRLVDGIVEHIAEIDPYIRKYAPEWPIDQITVVDRNILRLGIFELAIAREVPAKVAINEAIELAKAFGGESSGRFVNGVLGAIYKDITGIDESSSVETSNQSSNT